MTSKTEGFPNALLEAASIGVPVVVTNFSGIGDYIVDGENALVVPVGDSQAISHAIARIMDDDDLARKLSAGSLALSQKFRPEIEKAEWLELYEAVLG
jgi:glycosyltransferase involved in cell wall biosynthesis